MTKLPIISSNELIEFLATLGYQYDHQKGDHIILKKDGSRRLSVPRRKEMGKGLLSTILAEAQSSKDDFISWRNNK